MKRQLWGTLLLFLFFIFLTCRHFASRSCLISEIFLLFFLADSTWASSSPFIYITIFLPGSYVVILNAFLPLKKSYIYNILMVYNKILFSILTRNDCPITSLLISSNTVSLIDRNEPIVLDLELTCPLFSLPSYLLMILFLETYFEQNGSFYIQENN